jgi:hypothetical protein
MELEAEVHGHAHKTGHQKIDLALALSALALSVGSIIISIQNEGAMHRLVTANSWPCLQMSHGNVLDGERILHFDVRNAGIGPATVEKAVVTYKGQAVRSAADLLQQCCNAGAGAQVKMLRNALADHVFSPRDTMSFLAVMKDGTDPAIWDKLDAERFHLDIQVCYRSVFDEYWTTRLGNPRPVKVHACEVLAGDAYEPDPYALVVR